MYRFIIVIFTLSLLNSINSYSQCIQGDCKEGYGKFNFSNGDIYEGEWEDDKFHGKGKYLYNDGSYFEGLFKNNKLDGDGIRYDAKNDLKIIGSFENWKLQDGKVKFIFGSGEFYEGGLKDLKFHGKGKYTSKDKSYYEGEWDNDKKSGYGKYVYANKSTYEGEWKNDLFHGKGTYTYHDKTIYEGEWKDGKEDGYGVIKYSTGEKYEGYWSRGKEHGHGTYYFNNGNKMVGEWSNGNFIETEKSEDKIVAKEKIKMTKTESGIYEIPISINGTVTMNFIMDTGASEMFITYDILSTLIKNKTIDDSDILEGKSYMVATGEINRNVRFNIKEIKLGSTVIKNIECAVAENLEAPILLGSNVLSRLGKVMLDFDNEMFYVMD